MIHALLSHTVNTYLRVESGDGLYLLIGIAILAPNPTLQFRTVFVGSVKQGIDEHEGLLVTKDIATDFLAKNLRVTINIKIVILKLEGKSEVLSETVECLCILF